MGHNDFSENEPPSFPPIFPPVEVRFIRIKNHTPLGKGEIRRNSIRVKSRALPGREEGGLKLASRKDRASFSRG